MVETIYLTAAEVATLTAPGGGVVFGGSGFNFATPITVGGIAKSWGPAAIAALTEMHFVNMTGEELQTLQGDMVPATGLSEAQFRGVGSLKINNLQNNILAKTSDKVLSTLPLSYLNSIDGEKFAALVGTRGKALTPDQLSNYWNKITATMFPSGPTAEQFRALGEDIKNISNLNIALFEKATPAVLATLPGWQLALLTGDELGKFEALFSTEPRAKLLSATQLAGLEVDQLKVLSHLATTTTFNAAQLIKLNAQQIGNLGTNDAGGSILSVAVIKGLSAAQIAGANLTGFVPGDMAPLTLAQVQAFTGDQIRQLSAEAVAALSPKQLAVLNSGAAAALDPPKIQALLDKNKFSAFTSTQMNALSANFFGPTGIIKDLSRFSTAQVSGLNAAQVEKLSPALFGSTTDKGAKSLLGALSAGSTEENDGIDGLTFAQVQGLSTGIISGLTATQIADLSSGAGNMDQMDALTSNQINKLTATAMVGFSAMQIADLDADQVKGFTGDQLAKLSTSAIEGFTTDTLSALTTTQISKFTTAQINALTAIQIKGLASASVRGLTGTQLGAVNNTWIANLTAGSTNSESGAAVETDQIDALTSGQIKALSTLAVSGFTSTQIRDLTSKQMAGFTPAQIQALTPLAVLGFTSENAKGLSPAAIAGLTRDQTEAMAWGILDGDITLDDTNPEAFAWIQGLSPTQISKLSTAAFSALPGAQLALLSAGESGKGQETHQIDALTAAQLASLWTGEPTLGDYGPLSELSVEQVRDLSNDQLKALSPGHIYSLAHVWENIGTENETKNVVAFTTAQIASLSPLQISGFDELTLGCLSTNQVKALTAAQLTALEEYKISALSTDQLQAIDPAKLKGLSYAQIQAIVGQDNEATGTTTGTTAALAGFFTAAQITALTPTWTNPFGVKAGTGIHLENESVTAFTPAEIATLGAKIIHLTTTQICLLNASQIAMIDAKSLTRGQVMALTPDQVAEMTAAQIKSLTTTQISLLSAEQIGAIETIDLAGMTVAQISSLDGWSLDMMSSAQVRAMTTAQISALSAPQLKSLASYMETIQDWGNNGLGLSYFSDAQAKALTTKQITSLTGDEIEYLGAQSKSLSAAAIGALTVTQFKEMELCITRAQQDYESALSDYNSALEDNLDQEEIDFYTNAMNQALHEKSIATANRDTFFKGFGTTQIKALTAAQIKGLSTGEAVALLSDASEVKALSVAAVKALTKEQINAIGGNANGQAALRAFTSAQVAALGNEQKTWYYANAHFA